MKNNRLHPIQVLPITTATTLGVSILMLQQELAKTARQDAWISMLIGGLIAISAGLLIYYLSRKHQNLDLPEMALAVSGKIAGRILVFPLVVYVLFDAGFSIRIFAQSLKLFLLDRTPVYVVTLLMIIVLISVVRRGIRVIAGVIDLLLPFFIIALLMLITLSTTQIDMLNMKPILFENTYNVFKASLPAYGALIGYGSIAYIMKYVDKPKRVLKWFLAGVIVSIILYTGLTLVTILAIGPEETKNLMFPTLFLSKSIEITTMFFERLEAFMVIIWIPAVFTTVSVFCFASVRNISVLLSIKPKYEKYVAYAHIPLLFLIAQFSVNEIEALKYMRMIENLGILQGLVFIPLLVILTLIKERRKSKNA